MKDFIGNTVNVGDRVASTAAGYCSLNLWTIAKVNPKTVQLERTLYHKRRADGAPWTSKDTVRRAPHEFIKVDMGFEAPKGV